MVSLSYIAPVVMGAAAATHIARLARSREPLTSDDFDQLVVAVGVAILALALSSTNEIGKTVAFGISLPATVSFSCSVAAALLEGAD